MVFSDTSTKLGLIQDVEQLLFNHYGDITSDSSRLYDFTARINRSYDKVATLIMAADGKWQWDDTNHTDLPIGATALVSGQRDYTMDVEFLDVLKVVITDSAGNKNEIFPYGINDPMGTVEVEDLPVTPGIPHSYRKTGNTFMLYPVPNYSVASGLTVYYQRKPSYFAYTDTTKSPGIPSIYHRYLSLNTALDYAITKQLTVKNDLAVLVKEMEDSIQEWYSKRAKDEGKFIRGVIKSSR